MKALKKKGKGYVVKNTNDKKPMSKKKAEKQVAAIMISKMRK